MDTNKNNIFEKHPRKTLAIIILAAFILMDFTAAATLKSLGKFEPSYISSKVLEATYRKRDPVFHHALSRNIDFDQAEWGRHYYSIHTNSLGFKDSKVRNIPLKSSKPRILLIGDSFTEGVGVEFKDTFAGILQRTLAQNDIEVLNAAVSSYSPIIYFRKTQYLLETVGLKFDYLIVFIDLSDMEDEAKGYKFDQQGNVISRQTIAAVGKTGKDQQTVEKKTSFKEFISQNTVLLGRIRNLAGWLRNHLRPWTRSLNQRRGMWTLDDKLYADYAETGLALADQHMSQLKALLDQHGIPLTVVVYPWPDQIYHNDIDSRQIRHWQQWSNRNNAGFINLFPAFINNKQAPEQTIKTLFIQGDVHWNNKGHQLIASRLLEAPPFNHR